MAQKRYLPVIGLLLIGQTAWPLLFSTTMYPALSEPFNLFVLGVVNLAAMFCFFKWVFPLEHATDIHSDPNVKPRGLLYYLACVCTFTCVIDFVFFLEVEGIVAGFMAHYLRNGEPYFATAYGSLSLAWDGTCNLLMYLLIVYKIDNRQSCRNLVLFWSATMVTSLFTLVLGAMCGSFATQLHPATLLNIPYALFPAYFLMQFLLQPRSEDDKVVPKEEASWRWWDMTLVGLLMLSCVVGGVRGVATMNSPHPFAVDYVTKLEPYLREPAGFGASWPLFFMFVGTFLQFVLAYGLLHPGSRWMKDVSIIYTSITVYGTYIHLLAQFHPNLNEEFRSATPLVVVGVNLLLPLSSLLILLRALHPPPAKTKTL